MKWAVAVSLTIMVVLAGCKGGGNEIDANTFSPDSIQQANQSRLEPADDQQAAAVSGQLTINGFTVLDEAGQPGMDTNGAIRAAARLLDPGDDILSEDVPGLDGRFMLTTTNPVSAGIVEIEFKVEEDVDGDGEGEDTIVQRIPVALAAGRTAELTLELSKGLSAGIDSELAVAPQDGMGEFMVTRYQALDASGSHESYYGTFFGSASVIYDVDRDEFLEAGDDISLEDSNSNGWADESENSYETVAGATSYLQGVIASVNTAKQQFTVRHPDGSTTTVDVLPFAGFEVLDESGEFVGQSSLGQHLVGMEAIVEGSPGPGARFAATWVVVRN